jgi:hypothetical protein
MAKAAAKKPAKAKAAPPPAPGSVPGHNAPAPVVLTAYDPATDKGLEALLQRRTELLSAGTEWARVVKITSDEEASALEAFKTQAIALGKEAIKLRDETRKPYGESYDRVSAAYKAIADAMQMVSEAIQPLRTRWLEHKDAEIKRQQREAREAAEAEQRRLDELAERSDPTDLAAQMAVKEQAEAAEAAQAEADRKAREKARAGENIIRDHGQKRAATLVTVYAYDVRDSKACAEAWHSHPKAIALWRELAGAAHRADRTWTHAGITITESQQAR